MNNSGARQQFFCDHGKNHCFSEGDEGKLPGSPSRILLVVSQVTLRHLRYFIATAECGKIQDAAEKVYMSPSAVANAIKNLEEILGVKLFERHRTGVHLTYDGHRFLDDARSILRLLNDSIFEFQNKTTHVEGELVLGASVAVIGYFLSVPLSQFERIYPNVKIRLVENARSDLERQLRSGEIDIAFIITSNISASKGLEIHTLFRSERTVWCAEGHRFSSITKVSLEDIEKERYIMLSLDEAETNISQIWRRYGRKPNTWLKTQSVEAVRSFIAREQGVTILSNLLYRPWSLDGTRIISKPIVEPVPTMNLGIVWRRDRDPTPQSQCFIEFMKRALNEKNQSV